MGFKRSLWWGVGGGVTGSLLAFAVVFASKTVESGVTEFFLRIGLNPREQALLCLAAFIGVTAVAGFLLGRGIRLRQPHS